MSTNPVYAVPGEIYTPDMVMPPNAPKQYGYVVVDNERTRHFFAGSGSFPSLATYNYEGFAHGVFYVFDGIHSWLSGSHPKGFLGYDGSVHEEDDPVNQWYAGLEWMKACGTFAHHIAEYNDHYHMLRQPGTFSSGHTLTHSDESNMRNKVTLWWGRALNGEVFRRLVEWMPPGTIVHDMTIGLPSVIPAAARPHENWKLVEPEIASLMQLICDYCQGQNILRRFHRRCQPLEYLTALGSGVLAVPDFSEDVWRVRRSIRNMQTSTPTQRVEVYDELMEWNGKALDYYDENVAVDTTHQA